MESKWILGITFTSILSAAVAGGWIAGLPLPLVGFYCLCIVFIVSALFV